MIKVSLKQKSQGNAKLNFVTANILLLSDVGGSPPAGGAASFPNFILQIYIVSEKYIFHINFIEIYILSIKYFGGNNVI